MEDKAFDHSFAPLGQKLKTLREEKGMSIREIADKTRIPPATLDALEAGDPTNLPAPVFVKGFLRAYAKEVGFSADEIIQEYSIYSPQQPEAVTVPIGARADLLGGGRTWVWGLVLAAVVVVLGVAVYVFYPSIPLLTGQLEPSIEESGPSAQPETPAVSESAPATESSPTETRPAPAAKPTPAETASITSTPTAETTVASTASPEETPAAATETPVAQPAESQEIELKLVFEKEVWIKIIIDGDKDNFRHGLFSAGMSKSYKAKKKFDLRVGNAGGVRLYLNGKDLGKPGPDGVAMNLTFPPTEG